jgi:hypothetical protein
MLSSMLQVRKFAVITGNVVQPDLTCNSISDTIKKRTVEAFPLDISQPGPLQRRASHPENSAVQHQDYVRQDDDEPDSSSHPLRCSRRAKQWQREAGLAPGHGGANQGGSDGDDQQCGVSMVPQGSSSLSRVWSCATGVNTQVCGGSGRNVS